MGYLAAWKVLEDMVTDLKKNQIMIPAKIICDLKNARTVIDILKADPDRGENVQRIEEYLRDVESYLFSEGQKRFGAAYVDELLERVDDARRKVDDEEQEERFVPGFQRRQKWLRITPSAELPIEKLRAFAEESSLSCRVQLDGCLVVSGEEKGIKDFVKKIAAKCSPKAKK
jgi:hypothetical protein